jgi:hypothetical protein
MNAYERTMKEAKGWCRKCDVTPLISDKEKEAGVCFRCRRLKKMKEKVEIV